MKAKKREKCPDCDVGVGELHDDGCDIELCPDCGFQRLSCDCLNITMPRIPWDGEWPNTATCVKLGFWCKVKHGEGGKSMGWVSCEALDPDARPDYSRLYADCVWDKSLGEFVLKDRFQHTLVKSGF